MLDIRLIKEDPENIIKRMADKGKDVRAEVEEILAGAVIISAEDATTDHIGLGCTFTVKDIEMDEELTYELVGSQEADPKKGRVSDDAPFGRAMVGKKVGDIVQVEAPVGTIEYQVIKIAR